MGITTHILDISRGRPAAGVAVQLEKEADGGWAPVGAGVTDDDGRCRTLTAADQPLAAGTYRIRFGVGEYFSHHGTRAFYPTVEIQFLVAAMHEHYHVPLLLSPFGYSTYRGS